MESIGRAILIALFISHPLNYKAQYLQFSRYERVEGVYLCDALVNG